MIVVINFQFMYVVVKAWGNIIIGDDDVVWELPTYVCLSMVMQVALASGVTLDHQSNDVALEHQVHLGSATHTTDVA